MMPARQGAGSRAPLGGDIAWIVAGCLAMAAGFRLFLNGNHLVTGGVVGLSTLAERATGWEPAWFQWGINIPLLVLSFRVLGPGSGWRGILGSLLLPSMVLLGRGAPTVTANPLLAAVFGGALYGLGVGLVFRGGGSVGGFTIVAQFVARWLPIKRSTALLLLDALVLAAGSGLFGIETALYGLVAGWTMRQTIDAVLSGFADARAAWIVTAQPAAIRELVLREIDRGLTVIPAEGGYTGAPRTVLLTLVAPPELARLRARIREIDPDAFVFFTGAAEVMGKGFPGPG
ncbi:MAG: YitT family protein [Armatimonadota bacterium]